MRRIRFMSGNYYRNNNPMIMNRAVMKILKYFVLALLMISLESVISMSVSAQTPTCVDCGASGFHPVHKPGCRYYVAPKTSSGTSGSSSQSVSKSLNETLIQGAVNAILNMNTGPSQKELEEQKRAEELKAIEAAEAKRLKEEAERAEHEKLMDSYKPLGKTDVKYKALDESGKLTPVHFTCKLTSFKGEVQVKKANGTLIRLGEGVNFDLAVGDVITTGSDGMIKVHFAFEKGGEDLVIGKNTHVKIIQTPEGIQCPKIFDGKLRASNPSVKEAIEQTYDDISAELKRYKENFRAKFQVRTPSAVTSTRGTDFTVTENPGSGTEVIVMEGSVELKGYGSEASILIEAGFKGGVTPEGIISGPEKIDLINLEKWWEEEIPE
jgi:hypothetical protein